MTQLKVQTVNINQTEAVATLSYDQIVETLGMRVGLEGNLSSIGPGTNVALEWGPEDASGECSVIVHVVQDHNFVVSAPPSPAQPADVATADPSLNSAAAQPAVPVVPPPAPAAAPVVSPPPAPAALQIPSAPQPAAS